MKELKDVTFPLKLSISASKRWLTCTASPLENALTGTRSPPGRTTMLGSYIHFLAYKSAKGEICTKEEAETQVSIEYNLPFHATDKEHERACHIANMWRDYLHSFGGELFLEHRVSHELMSGKLDAAVILPDKIHIVDLKTGHKPVNPRGNTQLELYAITFLKPEEHKNVQLTIFTEMGPSSIYMTSETLLDKYEIYKTKIELAAYGKGTYQIGECYYCPSNTACTIYQNSQNKLSIGDLPWLK